MVRFSGNVSFRLICRKKQAEYSLTKRQAQKDDIARSIVLEVKRRGGRFLRRHKCKSGEVAPPGGDPGWIEVEDDVAIEKAKQTIRDNKNQHLEDEEAKRQDNDSRHVVSSQRCVSRTASLPDCSHASASKQLQQPAVRLPRPRTSEFERCVSHPLPGYFPENQPGTGSPAKMLHRHHVSETDRAAPAQRSRSLSLPSIPPHPPFAWNPQQMPWHQFHRHRQERAVDAAALLDRYGLPQVLGTSIGFAHGLLGSHFQGQGRPNHLRVQQNQIEAFPDIHQRIQALSPDQRARILLEIPRAYQDLLPVIFANARQNGRSFPLVETDVALLLQSRSLALQLGDDLRVSQVDAVFAQTGQGVAGQEQPAGHLGFPESMFGDGRFQVPCPVQQQQVLPYTARRDNYSASRPMDDSKPAAATGARPRDGINPGCHLQGNNEVTTDHRNAAVMRQPQANDDSSTESCNNLPLKKRARRGD